LAGALGRRTCDTIESQTRLLAVRTLAVDPGFKIASQNTTPPTESQTMLLSLKDYSWLHDGRIHSRANLD
jgi:hypothetical protein